VKQILRLQFPYALLFPALICRSNLLYRQPAARHGAGRGAIGVGQYQARNSRARVKICQLNIWLMSTLFRNVPMVNLLEMSPFVDIE